MYAVEQTCRLQGQVGGALMWLRHWTILESSLIGLQGEILNISHKAAAIQGFRPGGGSLRYVGQPINWPINLHEFPRPQGGSPSHCGRFAVNSFISDWHFSRNIFEGASSYTFIDHSIVSDEKAR